VRDILLRGDLGRVVAVGNNGVYRSFDSRTFIPFPSKPPGFLYDAAYRPANAYPFADLFIASSSGLYWQAVPPEVLPNTVFTAVATFTNMTVTYVQSPHNGSTPGPVYANVTTPTASRGLWRSPDGVNGWQRVLPDVEVKSLVVPFGCNTTSDPNASNRVYVATRCPTCTGPGNLGVLWVSSNQGLAGTWAPLPFPTKHVNDLAVVCSAVTNRWIFAANGETLGPSVWRSLPGVQAMGENFEPWSNGIPEGGANTFRGDQGILNDGGVLVGTNVGLYRLGYNLNNAWAPVTVRGMQSPIVYRWLGTYTALDVATSGGVSLFWGTLP
jgi:hypothetical protein